MLTGREGLVRLIGKRRKILPDRQSFLLTPPESCKDEIRDGLSSSSSTNGVEICESSKKMDVVEIGRSVSSYVTCPVCGASVQGSDQQLNSHLDVCLMGGGTKRKLKQPTLFQFSFKSSVTKPKDQLDESNDNLRINNGISPKDEKVEGNAMTKLPVIEDNDDVLCVLPLNSFPKLETREEVKVENLSGEDENPSGDDIIGERDVDVTLSLPIVVAKHEVDGSTDDTSVAIFQTFIVGRKFGEEVDLKMGDTVCFVRDQYNVKDPNAIKVICTDSGCEKVLGYIPRELARYLSPLIEKDCLMFEVSISALPKRPLDVVPIQVVCQRMTGADVVESNDHGTSDSVWEDILHVVDCAKNFIPGKRKYQQNFLLLIQEVMRSHQHLFIDEEKLYLESFKSLSDDSQNLFVRLFTRKGPWFRMSNISYQEVTDSQQAVEGLCARGYMCSLESMKEPNGSDIKEVLDVLAVSELRDICSLSHPKKGIYSSRKQELISLLSASYDDGKCPSLPIMVLDRTGNCIRVSSTAESLLWRVQRLFFLNGEQDLNAFLMVDLGLVKYPAYTCIVHNQIFPSRADLLAYEEALEVAQIMDESLEVDDHVKVKSCIELSDARISSSREAPQSSTPPTMTFHSSFSDSYIYSKVVTLGISYLERERRYEDAIRLLKGLLDRIACGGRRGYWTLRLSVDLEHLGRLNESLSVAEEGLLDPWVRAGSKMALQRRILRLGKPPRRWKTPSFSDSIKRTIKEVQVLGRPLNCDLGMKNRFYGEDGEQCGVEELALQYYANEGGGWHGVHTESGIWMTIFGLIMWDIIFADIPDVFHTRFQTSPLDFDTDNFYIARESLIESHLQNIYEGMAEEILITSWESHIGTACRGVNWDRHSLSDLRAAVTCVGGPSLASLCRLLAQDYRSWSSGMPDLFLWRFSGDYKGEAKLVEVKGPRDRLSEQQRAWLLLLMDCGFSAEVCKVSPSAKSV
ncbi:fanconi-associated nuclease 1 homolog [Papaver somniferum]|uniref:fanconi-associated nuclease 1 homolog n=1 Tax=Papaver somniferum TaxID=3469 RepID=UPI000E6FB550|nr:fanconi-associated nuclease 1 homolog [Papaver somniferum]